MLGEAFEHVADAVDAGAVALLAAHAALGGPAPVAVHDDRDVAWAAGEAGPRGGGRGLLNDHAASPSRAPSGEWVRGYMQSCRPGAYAHSRAVRSREEILPPLRPRERVGVRVCFRLARRASAALRAAPLTLALSREGRGNRSRTLTPALSRGRERGPEGTGRGRAS